MAPSGCFYRLHHALLGVAKLKSTLSSTGAIGASAKWAEARRRGDSSAKCGTQPMQKTRIRDSRTSASDNYASGASGGWFADNYGNPYKCADWMSSWGMASVGCSQPGGTHTGYCQGLCGARCTCWLGICGNNYHCQYNKECCIHDYECANAVDPSCLLYKHKKVGLMCRHNQDSPSNLKGPLRRGQGCSTNRDAWCKSGRCEWKWSWHNSGWFCQ